MLNTEAIMSQKIAVGLVENPCCWALEALAAHVPASHAVVELGAYRGRSTGWLAMGAHGGNGAHVYSVDPWEKGTIPADYPDLAPSVAEYNAAGTRQAYQAHLDRTGVRPLVTTIQATAVEAARSYQGPPVGLIWHDAIHDARSVAADLRAWVKHAAEDAVIVLHDTDDARFGVAAGAARVLTTKANTERWDWAGRIIHPWAKNQGKTPEQSRRGFTVVYSRRCTYPTLDAPITARLR